MQERPYERKVKIFTADTAYYNNPYEYVEKDASYWLNAHPQALIIGSHVNLESNENYTEYVLTLIVAEPAAPKQEPVGE
jgi:hypothetical protein